MAIDNVDPRDNALYIEAYELKRPQLYFWTGSQ